MLESPVAVHAHSASRRPVVKSCQQWIVAFLFLVLLHSPAHAGLRVSGLFSPQMVLQRGQKVPVWGWSAPDTKITVSFLDQKVEGVTGEDGKWMVHLQPLTARSEGTRLTVSSPDTTIVIDDVVVGEVWLCSGQSNMEFRFWQLVRPAKEKKFAPVVEELRRIMNTESDPLLRSISIQSNYVHGYKVRDFNYLGWEKSAPGANRRFSGVAYFFGKELRKRLKVPVGLIAAASGGTAIRPFIPEEMHRSHPNLKGPFEEFMAKVRSDPKVAKANEVYIGQYERWARFKSWGIREQGPRMSGSPYRQSPAGYFNGMINPLVPFGIKGVIWYQGEADKAEGYDMLQTALIESWRQKWSRPDMPFYWAQLSSRGAEPKKPDDKGGYAGVRDAQFRCLAVPNTGMVVTTDVGEHKDVHPRNKIDVGKRFALLALGKAYGLDLHACMGPLYKGHKISGNTVTLTFDNVGSGLMAGKKHLWHPAKPTNEALTCFAIRGKDGNWKWGNAKISGKNTVTVSHPEVAEPVEVRYAWAAAPLNANLYNKEGLPASPFSTLTSKR